MYLSSAGSDGPGAATTNSRANASTATRIIGKELIGSRALHRIGMPLAL